MSYYGNEDAGDLSAASAAGYSEACAEEAEGEAARVVEEYGENCGWCGEKMVDPVFHCKGTRSEEGMCKACSEEVNGIPHYDDGPEDFGADNNGPIGDWWFGD